MIVYRRKALPAPLRAVAWRQPSGPLVVVVDDSLSSKEARQAAVLAVRKLPGHQSHEHPIRTASSCVALLAALTAASLGVKVTIPLPDVPPHPRRGRVVAMAVLETAPQYLSDAPAGALAG